MSMDAADFVGAVGQLGPVANVFMDLLDDWTAKADVMPELALRERGDWWAKFQDAAVELARTRT